jgi:hypothetical protein
VIWGQMLALCRHRGQEVVDGWEVPRMSQLLLVPICATVPISMHKTPQKLMNSL